MNRVQLEVELEFELEVELKFKLNRINLEVIWVKLEVNLSFEMSLLNESDQISSESSSIRMNCIKFE